MSLELCLGDLRFAWRAIVRRPAFTSLVVLTLALGVGVNSAVFALVDAVLLRPLPYRDPSRLAFVWQTLPDYNVFELEATPFDYDAWHQMESFSEIGSVDPRAHDPGRRHAADSHRGDAARCEPARTAGRQRRAVAAGADGHGGA